MEKFNIYYRNKPTFTTDESLTVYMVERITHTFVKTIEAENINDAYAKMQAENWSPNGEARNLIESKDLHHTSMSIGDVIIGKYEAWQVASVGWLRVPNFIF